MRKGFLHAGIAAALALAAAQVRAQSLDPTPETTPPIELDGSIPTDAELAFDGTTWFITDELGARSGASLFHSFGRFDVPSGQIAEFSAQVSAEHPALPERVFARVTWGEPSDIEGTLRSTIPDADLYLINPAGVHLAGGARVEVSGSFVATSADVVRFGEDLGFSASEPGAPPLLTWEEPTHYGFLPGADGAIEFKPLDNPLSVPAGETFAAIGTSVRVGDSNPTPTFSAPGARVALIAAGPGIEVPAELEAFDPSDPGLATQTLGAVSIALGSSIQVSGPGAPSGSVLVRGGSFELTNASSILATQARAQDSAYLNAVDIAVRDGLRIDGFSLIQAGTTAERGAEAGFGARGGDLRLSAGSVSIVNSEVLTATTRSGDASDLYVRAGSLSLSEQGRLLSRSSGSQTGGAIQVGESDAPVGQLTLSTGGRIQSDATRAGDGGPVRVFAAQIDASDAGFSPLGTLIASTTSGSAPAPEPPAGDAGNIAIVAERISLRDGAQVVSSTRGSGNAGSVTVSADSISLDGSVVNARGDVRQASIETRAVEGSKGVAGQPQGDGALGVSIAADELRVANRALISTSTKGEGRAGDLVLGVENAIRLEGGELGPALVTSGSIATASNADVGRGGDIRIATRELSVLDGSQITSSTSGRADAGSVDIDAGHVLVAGLVGGNESGIFAQTLAPPGLPGGAGSANGIAIRASGDVEVRDGARLSVETNNEGAAGDISIDTQGRLLLDAGSISARANAGATAPSGSISIAADQGVFASNGSVIGSRSFGTKRAGTIFIDAGPALELRDSNLTTQSTTLSDAGGGTIEVVASGRIVLTDSLINTSVEVGGGDGGSVSVDPELVVLNRSSVLAKAVDGNGGSIRIVAGSFVASSDSVLDASSDTGIDGTVVIESPESELASERAQPAQEFLDPSGLLRTACGASASQSSSFVVERVAGLPATPEGPLPAPLWEALDASAHADAGSGAPALAGPVPRLPAAALAGGCAAQEGSG